MDLTALLHLAEWPEEAQWDVTVLEVELFLPEERLDALAFPAESSVECKSAASAMVPADLKSPAENRLDAPDAPLPLSAAVPVPAGRVRC